MIKTPSDKWKKSILKYKKQCQSIIQISNNIRYVGVINNYGRTLTGVIKPNLKPFFRNENKVEIIKNSCLTSSDFNMGLRVGFITPVNVLP